MNVPGIEYGFQGMGFRVWVSGHNGDLNNSISALFHMEVCEYIGGRLSLFGGLGTRLAQCHMEVCVGGSDCILYR